MFTGMIQVLGQVEALQRQKGQIRLAFSFQKEQKNVQEGESIAVNGVCLTAVQIKKSGFKADLLPETLSATNLGKLKRGSRVNLERSLKWGDSIGGHFVTGHVDAVGRIAQIQRRNGNWSLLMNAPKTIIFKLVPKGSIACDGISLTVQALAPQGFYVAVIPHTLSVTTLGKKKIGDEVNLEIDLLFRYRYGKSISFKDGGLSAKVLQKQGF